MISMIAMLSTRDSGLISSPIEMKNIIMNMSFIGRMSCSMILAGFAWDTITPIMNAPIAMDSPTRVESHAMQKQSPRATIRMISSDIFSPIQSRSFGMNSSPRPMAATMNTMMVSSIQTMDSADMASPVIIGDMADRMMTCATSSTTVMRMTVSTSACVSLSWSFRTMVTTAVEEPEMMAPKMMACRESSPRNSIPRRYPPKSISGTWIMTTIMANEPIFRSFFRLSSIPMQNMRNMSPRSERKFTMSSVSSDLPDQ